ncbi:hypothetical protein [Sulfurimonas sp. HSL3-7]|uniref:hypothetical protein n=1 Tax=Sulfonitrofixus jiaomeiensis TaxID=3131938 RepID=UPI0031F84437
MKIWISEENAANHRLVRFNCEEHSDYRYLGDLSDAELSAFFTEIKPDIDAEKNLKLIKYFGYLHIFVIKK